MSHDVTQRSIIDAFMDTLSHYPPEDARWIRDRLTDTIDSAVRLGRLQAHAVPLEQLGVVSVSVKAESFDGIHPMNASGISFRDGRVLPTWDWMAEPAERKPGRLATVKRNGK